MKDQPTFIARFFVFCGGRFGILIRGLLVRGLEPKFKKSGTGGKIRKFWEGPIALRAPSRLRAISVFSVPNLALADRARIKNSKWPSQNTRHAR